MTRPINCAFVALAVMVPAPALAHQPWLVDAETVRVSRPEVSKAYYSELKGVPHIYIVDAGDSLSLYVNVLAPAISGAERDYLADVYSATAGDTKFITSVGGPDAEWRDFHEPVANDHYWQGPEFRARVPAGRYLIRVSSPDNEGKYVLAVGEKESFPPAEIARTYGTLPRLKQQYFGKSPLGLLLSGSGIGAVVVVAAVAGIVVLVVHLARR